MTPELLLSLTLLFAGLFILGSLLCLPLFHWNLRRFFASALWVKIFWWIPIYGIFLLLCYGKIWVALPVIIFIFILAFREYTRQRSIHTSGPLIVKLYFVFFTIATLHIAVATLAFDPKTTISLLITICFCSVLSDVCAFFLGSYASWHKLPSWVNPQKSWEGVAGQLIGASIGAGLAILATGDNIT